MDTALKFDLLEARGTSDQNGLHAGTGSPTPRFYQIAPFTYKEIHTQSVESRGDFWASELKPDAGLLALLSALKLLERAGSVARIAVSETAFNRITVTRSVPAIKSESLLQIIEELGHFDVATQDVIAAKFRQMLEEMEERRWKAISSQPRVRSALRRMAEEALEKEAKGETEEGGFGL